MGPHSTCLGVALLVAKRAAPRIRRRPALCACACSSIACAALMLRCTAKGRAGRACGTALARLHGQQRGLVRAAGGAAQRLPGQRLRQRAPGRAGRRVHRRAALLPAAAVVRGRGGLRARRPAAWGGLMARSGPCSGRSWLGADAAEPAEPTARSEVPMQAWPGGIVQASALRGQGGYSAPNLLGCLPGTSQAACNWIRPLSLRVRQSAVRS